MSEWTRKQSLHCPRAEYRQRCLFKRDRYRRFREADSIGAPVPPSHEPTGKNLTKPEVCTLLRRSAGRCHPLRDQLRDEQEQHGAWRYGRRRTEPQWVLEPLPWRSAEHVDAVVNSGSRADSPRSVPFELVSTSVITAPAPAMLGQRHSPSCRTLRMKPSAFVALSALRWLDPWERHCVPHGCIRVRTLHRVSGTMHCLCRRDQSGDTRRRTKRFDRAQLPDRITDPS